VTEFFIIDLLVIITFAPVNSIHKFYTYRVCQKMTQLVFVRTFVKSAPNLIIFGTQIAKTIEICKVQSLSCPPHLVYVNALPRKTQML